jgi:hypothetical protein
LTVPDFAGCLLAGLLSGLLAIGLTHAVYGCEDAFDRLPVHWQWWPAVGGVVVGLGGLVFPQALGVGYDVIGSLLSGHAALGLIAGVLLVKPLIWAAALGSGTSGGVLAPLLMMGAALGGLEQRFLPAVSTGFWPLVSMSAALSGVMRVPFTSVVFALELTHDVNSLLPVMIAAFVAHGSTALRMRRSILTERMARRGVHVCREYAVDPLELLSVREVMRAAANGENGESNDAHAWHAHPQETLRSVVSRMARHGVKTLPVRDPERRETIGWIELEHVLRARNRHWEQEHSRERVLRLRLPTRRPSVD